MSVEKEHHGSLSPTPYTPLGLRFRVYGFTVSGLGYIFDKHEQHTYKERTAEAKRPLHPANPTRKPILMNIKLHGSRV